MGLRKEGLDHPSLLTYFSSFIYFFKMQGSPGNLQDFEDVLFMNNEMRESTIIMAVKLGTENGTRVLFFIPSLCLLNCLFIRSPAPNPHQVQLQYPSIFIFISILTL